jgi:hypothetical protein
VLRIKKLMGLLERGGTRRAMQKAIVLLIVAHEIPSPRGIKCGSEH